MAARVHGVDPVLAGAFCPANRKLKSLHPPNPTSRAGDVSRGSAVAVGEQLAARVHGVDPVLAGRVLPGEQELELQPSAESDLTGAETFPGLPSSP